MYLEDGTQRIFLSTKGKNALDISKELLHFLQYVEQSTTEVAENGGDEVVPRIHERVQSIKRDRELEVGYMYLQEYVDTEIALGIEEGLAKIMAEGRTEWLAKGRAEGKSELVISFLSDLGEVPDDIAMRIKAEEDLEILGKWVKSAARAKSIEEFRAQM